MMVRPPGILHHHLRLGPSLDKCSRCYGRQKEEGRNGDRFTIPMEEKRTLGLTHSTLRVHTFTRVCVCVCVWITRVKGQRARIDLVGEIRVYATYIQNRGGWLHYTSPAGSIHFDV